MSERGNFSLNAHEWPLHDSLIANHTNNQEESSRSALLSSFHISPHHTVGMMPREEEALAALLRCFPRDVLLFHSFRSRLTLSLFDSKKANAEHSKFLEDNYIPSSMKEKTLMPLYTIASSFTELDRALYHPDTQTRGEITQYLTRNMISSSPPSWFCAEGLAGRPMSQFSLKSFLEFERARGATKFGEDQAGYGENSEEAGKEQHCDGGADGGDSWGEGALAPGDFLLAYFAGLIYGYHFDLFVLALKALVPARCQQIDFAASSKFSSPSAAKNSQGGEGGDAVDLRDRDSMDWSEVVLEWKYRRDPRSTSSDDEASKKKENLLQLQFHKCHPDIRSSMLWALGCAIDANSPRFVRFLLNAGIHPHHNLKQQDDDNEDTIPPVQISPEYDYYFGMLISRGAGALSHSIPQMMLQGVEEEPSGTTTPTAHKPLLPLPLLGGNTSFAPIHLQEMEERDHAEAAIFIVHTAINLMREWNHSPSDVKQWLSHRFRLLSGRLQGEEEEKVVEEEDTLIGFRLLQTEFDLGITALQVAAEYNYPEIMEGLLEEADIYGLDFILEMANHKNSWTPLLVAIDKENTDVVKTLLDRGADKNSRDNEGWTAYDIAALRAKNKAIYDMLGTDARKGQPQRVYRQLLNPADLGKDKQQKPKKSKGEKIADRRSDTNTQQKDNRKKSLGEQNTNIKKAHRSQEVAAFVQILKRSLSFEEQLELVKKLDSSSMNQL